MIVDANTALTANKPQTALELANAVLSEYENKDCRRLTEDANIIAYAGIENMLADILLQSDNSMTDIPKMLLKMETECKLKTNPYIEAAHILQLVYERTQNVTSACVAMEHYVLEQRDKGRITFAYTWERIVKICPLRR